MLFVLASAVVAFKGWPQVGDQPTPTAVIIAQRQAPLDEHAIHRLESAGAVVRSVAATSAAAPGTHNIAASASTGVPSVTIQTASTATRPADRTTHVETGRPSQPVIGSAPKRNANPLAQTVNNTTGMLGRTVAGAGNAVASTVTGLTNALAKTLSGLSPGLGRTVQRTGDLVGSAVSGTTGVVGGLLAGTSQALGQLLRGHQ
jgi:hypothetical protein